MPLFEARAVVLVMRDSMFLHLKKLAGALFTYIYFFRERTLLATQSS